jgi:hypothetical protein
MREVKMKGHGMEWNELPVPSSFLSHVSIGPSHVDRRGQSPTVLTPGIARLDSLIMPRLIDYHGTIELPQCEVPLLSIFHVPLPHPPLPPCLQCASGFSWRPAVWPYWPPLGWQLPTTLARVAERAPNANHDVHHLGP